MRQPIDSLASKAGCNAQEPIAIVGSACRFPGGANNPSKLWDLLREPRDVLRKIPEDRFHPEAFYHPDGTHHGTSNVTESYLLEEDPRVFDAGFFNIKPVEAHATDPQHRILLETVFEALESAGLPIENVAGSQTAVYVGQMWSDYNDHLQRDMDSLPTYAGVGTARSILSNRISHFFDWHGPSATIDTACSSSLVAVYNAVLTLRNGDSPMAVVAGANVILTPEPYIGESKLKMLSHESRSRMWDEGANGYARGDGVAALILKPLSKALADGDHIESIVKECLVNQDGRTAEGITVPSSEAQAELIRRTYTKAGLDALNPHDRCQYFEAHGTGTGAGDPREARAIATAFFGQKHGNDDPTDKLYVGSIKTVIGHTEGTAGIAGIMKASLAVQNGKIPPNLLFNRLSPAVAPFYNNLEIPVTLQDWPPLPPGTPRRASINSFGFGGTNAHVILESFEQASQRPPGLTVAGLGTPRLSLLSPFVFSASSDKSLRVLIRHYVSYLDKNRTVSLADLSYSLSRRSALSYRVSFPAQSVEELLEKLNEWLEKTRRNPDVLNSTRFSSNSGNSRILGVFTGQGAQWATMGKELIAGFPRARSILSSLDQSLRSLPHEHRPQWSIVEELLADPNRSRLHLAAFAQPLCTAVQIMLVDFLRASGVNFNTVVGHSSGEIAAAYAAGFITASSAVRIAYYRGRAAALAGKNRSQKGAMMAIGTTLEDAQDLCRVDTLEGRIWIAAVNSPSSITVSGDADAIEEARLILEDEGRFARLLKVDTAYHSEHMLPCVESYLRAITQCDVSPLRSPSEACTWFSSVHAHTKMQPSDRDLSGKYWCDNMTQPVLLDNAVKNAWEKDGPFDAIVEVGAHPALKSPVLETLQQLSPKASSLAYTGLLSRNQNDILSFTQGLGVLWQNLGHGAVDLSALDRWVEPNNASPQLLKDLPTYAWDHDRIYWHESRLSRAYRTRKSSPHPLLGTIVPDGLDLEIRWRNLLRISEVPWVKGHTLQGQVVFPAAGYIVTAMEAAIAAARDRDPRFLAVNNVVIHRALTLEDDVDVETLVSLSNIRNEDPDSLTAEFQYHALLRQDSPNLTLLATASVELTLGPVTDSGSAHETPRYLPSRADDDQPNLLEVDTGDFYDFLDEVGYGYTGPFRALNSIKRKLDYGTGRLEVPKDDWDGTQVIMHPAFLDASFQAIFLAMGWPRDAGLIEVFVPTAFHSIKVDVANWKAATCECDPGAGMVFDSRLRQLPDSITGDVDVFSPTQNGATLIQVENIKVVPFSPDSAASHRKLYAKTCYCPVTVDGIKASGDRLPTDQEREMAWDLERVGIYFLRTIEDEFSDPESRTNIADHHRHFFDFSHDVLSRVSKGTMPYAKEEWLKDTWDDIAPIIQRYPDSLDLQLMQKVGLNMSAAIRGQLNMVEVLFKDDFMDKFYAGALGLDLTMDWLGRIALQLSQRYPHMNMLELGAGTGGATKSIFGHIGDHLSSYTFTDISAGFFSTAMDVFNSSKMIFKMLDAERDVVEQGFQEGSYDLVIASNILHATAKLDDTLRNARRLLKPGGYLLIAEVTCADVVRVRFPFSALPGWFRGHDDGRPLTATIDTTEWHQRLCRTGFSGVDTVTPEFEPLVWPSVIMLSQAVDDRVRLLRQPLYHQPTDLFQSSVGRIEATKPLVLVGGQTMQSSSLIGQVSRILAPWFEGANILRVRSLRDLGKLGTLGKDYNVINFADLESPALADLTHESFAGLKSLVERPGCVLWITSGCRDTSPQMNMSLGWGRVLIHEIPGLRLQFLDVDAPFSAHSPRVIAENFLRWKALADFEHEDPPRPLLWAREHELVFGDEGLKVPRITYDAAMNQRYTASRKLVVEPTDAATAPVQLRHSGTSWKFHKAPAPATSAEDDSLLKVFASSSTPCYGGFYAALADKPGDSRPRLTLSPLNGSFLSPEDLVAVLDCDVDVQDREKLLASIITELQAASILDAVAHGSTVLLHEPTDALAASVLARASTKNIRLICASSTTRQDIPMESGMLSWVRIERHSSVRTVRSVLPSDVMAAVDCVESGNTAMPAGLVNCLPRRCSRMALVDLVHQKATHGPTSLEILKSALTHVSESQDARPLPRANLKTPGELDLHKDPDYGLSVVIDWSSPRDSFVPAVVRPVFDYLSFKPDRTYVLFGLTSDLGQSLCDWMIQHGARHLVMTSRNPKVDPNWLQAKYKAGVKVRVFANDITDETALRAVVEEIRSSMPPIAGIANGAMVLRDRLFMDMPMEAMTETLDTKVKGSVYLDSIFGENSEFDLDFFVFFSSIAAVTGNRAQSNYSAANMFMSALAGNRRLRGLPASVMHIGAIMGVGYMARNLTRSILDNLWSAGATWISERDFHNCFAEAVLASKPGNGVNADFEFIVGLRQLTRGQDSPDRVLVMEDPRFSHLVTEILTVDDSSQESGPRKSTSVKHLLKSARTPESVERIIRDGFVTKLVTTLQLDTQMPEAEILSSRADELGVDSLVSVDLRTWFSKEISVEMPVLKLLGGSTVQELIAFALEKLPPALVPSLGEGNEDEIGEEEPAETVQTSRGAYGSTESLQVKQTSAGSLVRKTAPVPLLEMPKVPVDLETSDPVMPTFSSSRSDPSLLEDRFTDSEGDGVISLSSSARSTSPELEPSSLIKPQSSQITREVPMSSGQSRFWFLKHFIKDKSAFNITFWARLQGSVRVDELSKAVDTVGQAHEALRTSFVTSRAGNPVQRVNDKSLLKLEHHFIRAESDARVLIDELKDHEYDLEAGDLMRIKLLTLAEQTHILLIGYHHINMDGISLEVMLADIEHAYFGRPLPRPLQYSEYCLKQRRELDSDAFVEEKKYWAKELSNPGPCVLPLLPFSRTAQRKILDQYSHNHAQGQISDGVAAAIKAACRRTKTSMFHFLLAAYAVLLNRLLKVEDFCIGIADAGREMGTFAQSIGMYLNLLPVRLAVSEHDPFHEVLKTSRRKSQAAMAHGRLPFDMVLQEAGVERSDTHNPLFQAFLNYRPGVSQKRSFCGCEGTGEDWVSGTTSYDIMLDVIENPNSATTLRFEVQGSLYTAEDAQALMDSYLTLLESFANDTNRLVNQPHLFEQGEVQRTLALGRGREHVSGWPETVLHRIDRICSQQPGAVAITNGFSSSITYGGLQRRVQAIAQAVLDSTKGHHSGLVGVFCEPSVDAVCALLAVMWAGFAYVPLDPTLTPERLAVLVKTAQPHIILSHDDTSHRIAELGISADHIHHINISRQGSASSSPVRNCAKHQNPMAVHFTSGTTGTPKGVVLCHGTVVNVVEACADIYRTASNAVLQQTALNFDMALWQILVTLCTGGKLVVVPQQKRLDMAAVTSLIRQEEVTLTIATPSEYSAWLRYGSENLIHNRQWQIAVIGGEQYSFSVDSGLRNLQLPHLRLMNFYGPSEISFVSHYIEVLPGMASRDEPVPVGFALNNYAAYVLDTEQRPLAPGHTGEVYIAGAGVCRGYLNNSSLTNQKFVDDPFASEHAKSRGWTRMYKTGDKGRINSDGTLSILGRIEGDSQLKIRGVRMELEEIERAILKSSNGILDQVVVSPRGEGESQFLVAHALPSARGRANANIEQQLRDIVQNLTGLPRVMQPAVIVLVDNLPLNIHRKVDRRAVASLPVNTPQLQGTGTLPISKEARPLTTAQHEMLSLWGRVLERDMTEIPGPASAVDFFNLGGTSLQLMGVQAAIQERFSVSVSVADLFKKSSLEAMTALVASDMEPFTEDQSDADWEAETALPVIDWEAETALPVIDSPLTGDLFSQESSASVRQPRRVVALTGSTGFVGQAILNCLLAVPSVEKVHCLAVRDPMRLGAGLRSNPKVVLHQGDLRDASLCLSKDAKAELARTVDLIIHNGADVSFLKPYSALRGPNVSSTKFLAAELAAPRRVPITYISSAVVGRLAPELDVFAPVSLSHRPPPPRYRDAYGASKWASEVVLENANRDLGVPVTIRRLSSVIGAGIPEHDIMGNLVAYSKKLRAVPVTRNWEGVLDFVSVERVAQAAVADAMRRGRVDEVRYRHDYSDEVVPLDEQGISSFITKQLNGENVVVLPMMEWIRKAKEVGMKELVCTFLEQAEKEPGVTKFQRLLR